MLFLKTSFQEYQRSIYSKGCILESKPACFNDWCGLGNTFTGSKILSKYSCFVWLVVKKECVKHCNLQKKRFPDLQKMFSLWAGSRKVALNTNLGHMFFLWLWLLGLCLEPHWSFWTTGRELVTSNEETDRWKTTPACIWWVRGKKGTQKKFWREKEVH